MDFLKRVDISGITEHFMSDIHGENEAFSHLIRSASGKIRAVVDRLFPDLSQDERSSLTALIYYPEQTIERICPDSTALSDKLSAMREVLKELSSKAISESYGTDKESAISLAKAIQHSAFDHLHIVGDIYDRGPRPDIIMDELSLIPSLDIQWGNHDIAWMGAAAGSEICVANAVRIALRYNGFDMLELGYGIRLDELSDFAAATYNDDGFDDYKPSCSYETLTEPVDPHLCAQMHKAISIIQFKLEGQLAQRNPSLGLDHRRRLEGVNLANGTFEVDGTDYALRSKDFPTVDFAHPYDLTEQELAIIKNLTRAFRSNEKLRKHMDLLFEKGGVYRIFNGNLLFHGCVPLTTDGEIASVELFGKTLRGKEYFDFCDEMTRKAYYLDDSDEGKQNALDFMWYMWCGDKSPMFGKHRMTTFERYYTKEEAPREEIKNAYFKLREKAEVAEKILVEFGLNPETGRIINGHTPVKLKKNNESPIKADGKILVIDGGIAKPYRKDTGVAGFTLVFDGKQFTLCTHENPVTAKQAIEQSLDYTTSFQVIV